MMQEAKAPRLIRKPFYRLDEVCERWGMLHADIAAFALSKELQISVGVARLLVEVGSWDQTIDGECFRVPEGTRVITGLVDLFPEDAWWALDAGSQTVFRLKAPADEYIEPASHGDEDRGLTVALKDLVVAHAEFERFQTDQGLAPEAPQPDFAAVPALPTVTRGATPKFDWDAFWREVARSLLFDGVPESQAALVRRMEAWFGTRGEHPDSSTIKKKLSPLWREVAPEAERKRA